MSLNKDSTEEELVAYCASVPRSEVLGGEPYGNTVVKLSGGEVIKFGLGVTREEAENQRIAYKLVDPAILIIPCVHRFFSDGAGNGYIIMDYVPGRIIQTLEDPARIDQITGVLAYLTTLRGRTPGPLGGGPSRGLLFSDVNITFQGISHMEEWFSSRLFACDPKLRLQVSELVLCHLDLAPRNILWPAQGPLCLLDWASAGYYPRIFEFCAQWAIQGKDGKFNSLLLQSMERILERPSDSELAQRDLILRVFGNSQRYVFCDPDNSDIVRYPLKRIIVPGPPLPDYPQDWVKRYAQETLKAEKQMMIR